MLEICTVNTSSQSLRGVPVSTNDQDRKTRTLLRYEVIELASKLTTLIQT